MNITKKNRNDLKPYFSANAVPTQSHFEELIDGMVNQMEDGIVKQPGSPLSIEATGDDTGPKIALGFYESFADAGPSWTLALRTRVAPNSTQTKPGFSIGDAGESCRLFIDRATGNVGVGTVEPAARLHVAGDLCVDGSSGASRLFINSTTGHVGVGTAQPAARLHVAGDLSVDGNVQLSTGGTGGAGRLFINSTTGHVGVGTVQPAARLHVAGTLCVDGNVQINGQIQTEAWKDLTMLNGWTHGGGYSKPGCFKDSNGIVRVRGLVVGGNWANWTLPGAQYANTLFVLPAGYRPENSLRFINMGGWTTWTFQINPDGSCMICYFDLAAVPTPPTAEQKAANWLCFDTISFRAYP